MAKSNSVIEVGKYVCFHGIDDIGEKYKFTGKIIAEDRDADTVTMITYCNHDGISIVEWDESRFTAAPSTRLPRLLNPPIAVFSNPTKTPTNRSTTPSRPTTKVPVIEIACDVELARQALLQSGKMNQVIFIVKHRVDLPKKAVVKLISHITGSVIRTSKTYYSIAIKTVL